MKILGPHALVALLLVAGGCDGPWKPHARRDEIARRTQCEYNLRQISGRIVEFESRYGRPLTNIEEIGAAELICPSASKGKRIHGRILEGKYLWDSLKHQLYEEPGNHDPTRLWVPGMSNVIHICKIDGTNVTLIRTNP